MAGAVSPDKDEILAPAQRPYVSSSDPVEQLLYFGEDRPPVTPSTVE
jgi:hypothetical protein